jgi:hypothetical protein
MLLFTDSFDYYATAGLSSKWDVVVSPGSLTSITRAAARNGPGGLATNSGGYVQKNVGNNGLLTAGFALFVNGAAGPVNRLAMAFMDGSTAQVYLSVDGTGYLYANSGSNTLAVSSQPMCFGAWHYIEVKASFSVSGGSVQVRVDGNTWINVSGVNTSQTGNAYAGGVLLGDSFFAFDTGTFFYDDVYVLNASGTHNTSFLGDIKVVAQVPSANGSTNNYSQNAAAWAASTSYGLGTTIIDSSGNLQRVTTAGTSKSGTHPTWGSTLGATTTDNTVGWTCQQVAPLSNSNFVNEIPPDDNSSYLSDATPGDEDLYTFPTVSGVSVYAVAVNLRAEKDDASTRTIRVIAKSGSVTADNGSDFALSLGTYSDSQGVFETDPNTSSPWTIGGVNAAQFGIKTTA